MLGLLTLLINATVLYIPITAVPFIYTAPLSGCANFSAYVDPLSPWGIASVYAVSTTGALAQPGLDPYPTPKYVKGQICGDFISVRIDRWRSIGPAVPISVKGTDTLLIYQGVPLEINGTAIVKVKSFTQPQVDGRFYYKISSQVVMGVYVEEYVVYSYAKISAYGIANITYLSLSEDKPDYYLVVPALGVRVDGVKPWTPDFVLWFSPNQTAAVGKPRVVVEQVRIPVAGECNGTATVSNPLERPYQVLVKLDTGEEYALQMYQPPSVVRTWRLSGAEAKTADGKPLPVYMVTTEDGSPVAMCIVEGATYYLYVKVGDTLYRYPATSSSGVLEAYTDLVKPRVVLDYPGFNATATPEVARLGENITVKVYYNDTFVQEYRVKASPLVALNVSRLFVEVRVEDVLGSPIDSFYVYVGGLRFRGQGGTARILPLADPIAVEINGVKYLTRLQPTVRVPTLTQSSFLKIVAAAVAVGGGIAIGFKRRESSAKEDRDRDVLEI
ncbi:hypothetical protein Pogu_1755 [Pyrobaculum oguniense TE7]|uniref:Uncharacterized protein n=1 Tax=Pyrobaculum oguniense (strain DSM 13380 / JCM 10595 / TE7) TaxID=698757 RepID=H6QCG8_PYROT|nr:hypothetical protein Pogu_1755 [Pyrobaculum oguniense TE7]